MIRSALQLQMSIRQQVELELGREVADPVWAFLENVGRVGEVESGEQDVHWLAQEIRNAQAAFGAPAPWEEAPAFLLEEEYSATVSELRQRALSLLLAREASKDLSVLAFRNEFLNGQTLAHGSVEDWLKEQAQRDGPPRPLLAVPVSRETMLRQSSSWRVVYEGELLSPRLTHRYIEYSVPGDPWRRIQPIAPGGVLERLWKLIQDLRTTYRPWSEGQATLFILTGLRPQVRSIESRVEGSSRIQATTRMILTVDPAITPQELAEAYSRERAELSESRSRSLSEKHLRLAIFVAEANEEDPWGRKMQLWNETYPEAEFPGYHYNNRRIFHRDGFQACERLLHPQYQT